MMKEDESKNLSNQESFSPFVHWLIQNRKALSVVTSLLLVAVVSFAIVRSKNTKQYVQNIQRAEMLAENLEQASPQEDPGKAVSELMAICEKNADLKNRYNGIIAQELLVEGKQPQSYADGSQETLLANNLPQFMEFSEVTLLSQQENFADALAKAIPLLEKCHNFSLRAFLLLQIASLQRTLKQQEECKKTVEELKALLKTDPQGEKIMMLLQKQNSSLLDFLVS